jgi:diaminohydroxyphosphoribosylaminopyrimidine deaminase/5-amino-6-(5-phosphoribosylamino)uracil reductase
VRRVVAAVRDPDPRVDGRGFARLAAAGVEVQRGLGEVEARRLNDAFFHWHATGRPLVTLKAAASLDGLLAARGGASRWISGGPARRFAHRLRLRHDAMLVGAATVRRDNPQLTVRLGARPPRRLRAVLAPRLDLDPAARLFDPEHDPRETVRLYAATDAPIERERAFAGRARIVRLPSAGGVLDLAAVLADLGAAGARSVLVEGGGRTIAGFLREGLGDRLALFTAPTLLGSREATPLVDGESAAEPAAGFRLADPLRLCLGDDLVTLGRLIAPGAALG